MRLFITLALLLTPWGGAISVFEKLGYVISTPAIEPVQKVKVAYAKREGFPVMELLEPLDESSPICNILKKNGCTPYHYCYEVKNLKETVAEARKNGFMPLGKAVPGHGLNDALMVFLFNKEIGLVQIMQTPE